MRHFFLFLFFLSFSNTPHSLKAIELKKDELINDFTPQELNVVDPHHQEKVRYRGFSIVEILKQKVVQKLNDQSLIIFYALDGYESVIPFSEFKKHDSLLAFERSDGKSFQIDNDFQHEKQVALGPLYLVWDNTDEIHYWPYQINRFEIATFDQYYTALIPRKKRQLKGFHAYLNNCLSCHKLFKLGGDKGPELTTEMWQQFEKKGPKKMNRWLIDPHSINPNSSMPPLNPHLSKIDRKKTALIIIQYLRSMLK